MPHLIIPSKTQQTFKNTKTLLGKIKVLLAPWLFSTLGTIAPCLFTKMSTQIPLKR